MRKTLLNILLPISFVLPSVAQVEPLILHKANQDARCSQWVDSVMAQMSLKEKVGQLFIFTIAPQDNKPNMALLQDVVEDYGVGGLLFSGGELETQAKLTNEAQRMAKVPLMITFDGEWGLSMRLKGTPVFPRNMTLGCIEDEKLIYDYGKEVARQCRELGVQVNFAPVADVNINPKNPVINTRSFGENPENVANKVIAYSMGLESGGVLSVSKHFPGHGDTDTDSHHALPFLNFSRERLDSIELYPFKQAIRAGVGGMMVGHLEVPALEPQKGLPSSLSYNITTKLLVEELGFKGLVFTDALAMKGVASHQNVCLKAIKAGHDMVLAPRLVKKEIDAVMNALKNGQLTEEEINSKCRKILTYKYALGIHRQQPIQISGLDSRINTEEAKDLIGQINQAAVTVLKNKNGVLPLYPDVKEIALLHVGLPANAATFESILKSHISVTPIVLRPNMPAAERKNLHQRLAGFKRVIISISERDLTAYKAFLQEVSPELPATYVFFTSNKPLTQIPQALNNAWGIVLGHSLNKEVQQRVANGIFGKETLSGRLSASIGSLFKAGDGITISPQSLRYFIPDEYGMRSSVLNEIDSIALEGIKGDAYKGCQVLIMKNGRTMFHKSYGTYTGDPSKPITENSIFDIASLSKTSGTLLAVMKLYDKGLFNLSDKISDHLPYLKGTDKQNITIRELLYHESGLISSIGFYLKAIDKKSYPGRLYKASRDADHDVRIDARTYAQSKFKFHKGFISDKPTDEHTLQISDNMWLTKSFNDSIIAGIINTPLKDKRYRYSCVGFILLQKLVEEKSGMRMDEFLAKEFFEPMGLKHTAYLPLRYFNKEDIVPSSVDKFLRKTTLQGYVHDEAAAFQGGVSGNAGMFSNAEDIARIHLMIMNGGVLDGKRYLSKETCHLFTTSKSKISRRGLGFDKPDMTNLHKSPCCTMAPATVYGHTGFTGTCAWVDPTNNLIFVFMSNRIYPDPWVNELSKLNIRSRIQEKMYKSLQ